MLTAFEFGQKVAADVAQPRMLSSMSTGNSTNPPPGAWTGKQRVNVVPRTGVRGGNPSVYDGEVSPAVAARANQRAGNAPAPTGSNPNVILAPITQPRAAPWFGRGAAKTPQQQAAMDLDDAVRQENPPKFRLF